MRSHLFIALAVAAVALAVTTGPVAGQTANDTTLDNVSADDLDELIEQHGPENVTVDQLRGLVNRTGRDLGDLVAELERFAGNTGEEPTQDESPREESTPSGSNVTAEIEERIDSQVVLVSYEWSESTEAFELELRNEDERPTTVTVTESVQRAAGAGQMSIRRERLLPGDTTLHVPVEPMAGEAAVAITTSESIEQGTGTYVSTGVYNPGPWTATTPTAGWFGGITVMGGMMVAAAYRKMKDTHDAPEAL